MGFVGRGFKLLLYDLDPVAWTFLFLLALGSMWLGYRFSRRPTVSFQFGDLLQSPTRTELMSRLPTELKWLALLQSRSEFRQCSYSSDLLYKWRSPLVERRPA